MAAFASPVMYSAGARDLSSVMRSAQDLNSRCAVDAHFIAYAMRHSAYVLKLCGAAPYIASVWRALNCSRIFFAVTVESSSMRDFESILP